MMAQTAVVPIPLAPAHGAPKRLALLGATGSIGASTLDVVRAHPGRFEIVSVAAGSDAAKLAAIAVETRARFAAIADPAAWPALKQALAGTGIEAAAGPQAVIEAARRPADLVVAAIVGAAGVAPTCAALELGRVVALANKETLVCAGYPAMRAARRSGATVLPLDSEHNAIFQTLGGLDASRVARMVVTASGGPFRDWSAKRIEGATREQALAHPNWAMGPKISIDSATMMNKGLELIEAHHLFAIPADRLDVLVHPQSIVHGLVTFEDGMAVAGLAHPDMRVPVAHCLAWPERVAIAARALDLATVGQLTFFPPDPARFPALALAIDALRQGGAAPTALNAANEVAVAAFLAGRIGFGDIARTVGRVCESMADVTAREPDSVETALAVNEVARERTRAVLA
jgi:1-deoxy-D-xylulose-5-phosphate reductoisomerase